MENSTYPKTDWIDAKFEKVDEKIDKVTEDLSCVKADINVLFNMVESFKGLPETMNKLNETLVGIKGELNLTNYKLDEIDKKQAESKEEIKTQKERGKVDIIYFLSQHWWKIVMLGAVAFVLLREYF